LNFVGDEYLAETMAGESLEDEAETLAPKLLKGIEVMVVN